MLKTEFTFIYCSGFWACYTSSFEVLREIPISTWDEPIPRKIPNEWIIIPIEYIPDTRDEINDGGVLVCPNCIAKASRKSYSDDPDAIWLLDVIKKISHGTNINT